MSSEATKWACITYEKQRDISNLKSKTHIENLGLKNWTENSYKVPAGTDSAQTLATLAVNHTDICDDEKIGISSKFVFFEILN